MQRSCGARYRKQNAYVAGALSAALEFLVEGVGSVFPQRDGEGGRSMLGGADLLHLQSGDASGTAARPIEGEGEHFASFCTFFDLNEVGVMLASAMSKGSL